MKKESVLKKFKRYEREVELFEDPARFKGILEEEQREIDGPYSAGDPAMVERTPEVGRAHMESQARDFVKDFSLESGTALCLSGSGYRSMLFNAGALWRLNEAGYLRRINRISSVSSASIVAGLLGLKWPRLKFGSDGVAANLREEVIEPLHALAGQSIDVSELLRSYFLPFKKNLLIKELESRVFGDATLQDLPDDPRIIINATNLQSGALFRFSKPYIRDWRVGEIRRPKVSLASAVAASAAVPPLIVELNFRESDWTPGSGHDLQRSPFTTKLQLTDGAIYDPLGLETAWKRYRTILVSDGGSGQVEPESLGHVALLSLVPLVARLMAIMGGSIRSLRVRQVISSFSSGLRDGGYWGIRSDIRDYDLADALEFSPELTENLAAIPARFKSLPPDIQARLINWGYAVSDAAIRKYVNPKVPAPSGFPYPQARL